MLESGGDTARRLTRRGVAAMALGFAVAPILARAQPAENFYRGRRMSLIIPTSPGGINDLAGRLVARHLGAFIPGRPDVMAQNAADGGGLALANRFAATPDNDGSTIGIIQRGIAQLAIQGAPGANFDPLKLTWLGSLSDFSTDAYMLVVNANHPAKNVTDLKRPGIIAKIGADVPGSGNMTFAVLAKEVLGLNLDVVGGYEGAASMFAAMGKGELDGQVISLNSIVAAQPALWQSKAVRPLVQFGRTTRNPDLGQVPTARELLTDKAALELMEFAEMPLFMALPLLAPAGVPGTRAAVLQSAFMAMVKDKAFLDDAKKAALDVTPVDGRTVRGLIARMAATPKDVIARYNKVVAAKT